MRQHASITPAAERVLLTAAAMISALANSYFPFIETLVNFIWPVPIIILSIRHGHKWSILAAFASFITITFLLHPLQAATFVVGFTLIGMVIGHGFRQNYSPIKIFIMGAAASFVSKALFLAIALIMTGLSLSEIQHQMTASFQQIIEFYRKMRLSEQELQKMAETLPEMFNTMTIISPVILAMTAALDTYLNFQISRIILNKLGYNSQAFPPVKIWRVPRDTIYILIVSLLMLYWGSTREISLLYNAGLNIQMITTFLLILQGIALSFYFSDKYNLSKFKFGAILVILLLSGFFTQVMLFAGTFDLLFDYRRLTRPRDN